MVRNLLFAPAGRWARGECVVRLGRSGLSMMVSQKRAHDSTFIFTNDPYQTLHGHPRADLSTLRSSLLSPEGSSSHWQRCVSVVPRVAALTS